MESFIGWVGGKRQLRKKICEQFPAQVEKYVEVFGGAGWVLFYKDKHAPFEVYNDINSELVNLFRCVKHHPEAVVEELKYYINARELFGQLLNCRTCDMTDIQRASRYLYLIKHSFGCNTRTFAAHFKELSTIEQMDEIRQRLNKVIIENKSYDQIIGRYDREGTLFYCDPPYYKAEDFYQTKDAIVFQQEDHVRLRELLGNIKGKFVLSYNDHPFICDLYEGFAIQKIARSNNLASRFGKNKNYNELIITNY